MTALYILIGIIAFLAFSFAFAIVVGKWLKHRLGPDVYPYVPPTSEEISFIMRGGKERRSQVRVNKTVWTEAEREERRKQ